jgi:hypothetical protein
MHLFATSTGDEFLEHGKAAAILEVTIPARGQAAKRKRETTPVTSNDAPPAARTP